MSPTMLSSKVNLYSDDRLIRGSKKKKSVCRSKMDNIISLVMDETGQHIHLL